MDNPDRFVPWQRQTSRVIEKGSVVITELTVSYWGYSTQIHRPFAIGKEPSADLPQAFRRRLQCYESIRKDLQTRHHQRTDRRRDFGHRRPAASLAMTASSTAKPANRPNSATKSAAHPLERWTLEENMVHVIQPNPITKDFTAGLQLGAAVVVKPDGGESLHNYPFKFPVCG